MSLITMQRHLSRAAAVVSLVVTQACSEADAPLPAGALDPNVLRTPSGALAVYRGALITAQAAFVWHARGSGLLADELQDGSSIGPRAFNTIRPATLDARNADTERSQEIYERLHAARNHARQARAGLTAYAPNSPPSLRGELAALEGMAEVMLAELFCSGIPLNTVDFEGDWTLRVGSSTSEVYEHALVLFDSALVLGADSARITHLARIGRGRALLGLARPADAAQAVQDVPTNFVYGLPIAVAVGATSFAETFFGFSARSSVSDVEGGKGLPFRGTNDPRSTTRLWLQNDFGGQEYLPSKYDAPTATLTFAVATGVEARLIEAEAQLAAGSAQWLTTLNTLRASGGVAGLAPLADPGTAPARVDLLFRERAFWLFLTGHRQGDLRRLIRQYERDPENVYPTGAYGTNGGATGVDYGAQVSIPVPDSEAGANHLYTGCLSLGA